MTAFCVAIAGAGFWARYQLAAWREIPGVEVVAICDVDRAKAEAFAAARSVPAAFGSIEAMVAAARPEVVDVITSPASHAAVVLACAARGVPVICQKPMAPELDEAERLAAACAAAGVPLFVHENWRWQPPLRALRHVLADGSLGRVFRARIQFSCSFPVFDNQPFLKTLDRFILSDIGSHILDAARFLFGEAEAVTCVTGRVRRDIRGEDVATVLLAMRSGGVVVCEMSYASRLEHERFPETFVLVEAEHGSATVGPGCELRVTTSAGTSVSTHPPAEYAWVDPAYALVQSSMVACHADLLQALRGAGGGETTAGDNLRTLRLVEAAYQSAAAGRTVHLDTHGRPQPGGGAVAG